MMALHISKTFSGEGRKHLTHIWTHDIYISYFPRLPGKPYMLAIIKVIIAPDIYFLLCVKQYTKHFYTLSHLIIITNLIIHYHLQFIDKVIVAKRV